MSMRLALMAEMNATVRAQLFSGAFPVYAWMYHVRPFMRMNGVSQEQGEQFVMAVSGKGLSVRDVELLANGYFRGPESFRQEILKGNLAMKCFIHEALMHWGYAPRQITEDLTDHGHPPCPRRSAHSRSRHEWLPTWCTFPRSGHPECDKLGRGCRQSQSWEKCPRSSPVFPSSARPG